MSQHKNNVQDHYLNTLRREKIPVSVYLVNGVMLQGRIESFDQFVLTLRSNVNQMVYKHAVSSIVPGRAVRMSGGAGGDGDGGTATAGDGD